MNSSIVLRREPFVRPDLGPEARADCGASPCQPSFGGTRVRNALP
jgi:hypothetical protein